jgi:hypothetical protein
MPNAPNSGSILKFVKDFHNTYVDSQIFSPRLQAQIPSDQHRTIDRAESFNSQFISPHPTFFVIWDILVKQQSVTYTIASMGPITTLERNRRSAVYSVHLDKIHLFIYNATAISQKFGT